MDENINYYAVCFLFRVLSSERTTVDIEMTCLNGEEEDDEDGEETPMIPKHTGSLKYTRTLDTIPHSPLKESKDIAASAPQLAANKPESRASSGLDIRVTPEGAPTSSSTGQIPPVVIVEDANKLAYDTKVHKRIDELYGQLDSIERSFDEKRNEIIDVLLKEQKQKEMAMIAGKMQQDAQNLLHDIMPSTNTNQQIPSVSNLVPVTMATVITGSNGDQPSSNLIHDVDSLLSQPFPGDQPVDVPILTPESSFSTMPRHKHEPTFSSHTLPRVKKSTEIDSGSRFVTTEAVEQCSSRPPTPSSRVSTAHRSVSGHSLHGASSTPSVSGMVAADESEVIWLERSDDDTKKHDDVVLSSTYCWHRLWLRWRTFLPFK